MKKSNILNYLFFGMFLCFSCSINEAKANSKQEMSENKTKKIKITNDHCMKKCQSISERCQEICDSIDWNKK